jgi:hypothetical protein
MVLLEMQQGYDSVNYSILILTTQEFFRLDKIMAFLGVLTGDWGWRECQREDACEPR